VRKDYHSITNTQRRKAILDYITNHQGCNKEDVVRRLDKDEIASRVTVRKLLYDLIAEGSIMEDTNKDNARSVKLYIDHKNLLVSVPKNIEEILLKFESFTHKVGKIAQSEVELRHRMANSIFEETINEARDESNQIKDWGDALTSIPFIMLDIINDIVTFSLLFLLPRNTINLSVFSKICSNYFEKLAIMYPTISCNLSEATSNRFDTTSEYFRYSAYLQSKEHAGFRKVCYLAYQCYRFEMAEEMYKVLDLLWIKNIESVSLMYDRGYMISLLMSNEMGRKSHLSQVFLSHPENMKRHTNHLVYNNAMLNKIHEAINFYLVSGEYLSNQGKWTIHDSGY
jgi:Fe2+ or Zn2+ uptake regulation protein